MSRLQWQRSKSLILAQTKPEADPPATRKEDKEDFESYLQCRSGKKVEVVMELEKIRNLSEEELVGTEKSAAEQLFRLRFQKSLGNQEGIKKLRVLKLDIARAKTVVRERQIEAEKKANPIVKNAAPAKSTRTERKKATKA
jgi:large subunit ribosomal protein L29